MARFGLARGTLSLALGILLLTLGCNSGKDNVDRIAAFEQLGNEVKARAERQIRYLEQVSPDRAIDFASAGKWMRVENTYSVTPELDMSDAPQPPTRGKIEIRRHARIFQDPKNDHVSLSVETADLWFDTAEEAQQATGWAAGEVMMVTAEFEWQDGEWVLVDGWDHFPIVDRLDELDVYEKVDENTYRDKQVGTIRKLY